MAMAQASVDEKRWAYDTARYIGQTPDIVGYVVEWRRLGVALVATLVNESGRMVTWADTEAGGGGRLTGRYVFDPIVYPMATREWMSWTPQRVSGATEGWAANTAGKALVEQRRNGSLPSGRDSGEPLILAYYVGWPKVGPGPTRRPGLTLLVPADLRHEVVAPWGPSAW